MGIKLKTEEGAEFSFDTVAEFMEFKKQIDKEEASKETECAVEEDTSAVEPVIPRSAPKFDLGDKIRVVENKSSGHVVGTIGEIVGVEYVGQENRWTYVVHPTSRYLFEHSLRHRETDLELYDDEIKVEVGDKVRVVSSEDGTDLPYHYLDIGSVGKVVSIQKYGRIEVEVDDKTQYLLPHHYEKVETLGKDANGEDLYEGDYVTGTDDNEYYFTNSTVVMEVLGAGKSPLFEESNINVRTVGKSSSYRVDSSKFVKLSDNLDEAKAKFDEAKSEFKVGDKVEVVGNRARHDLDEGDVSEITRVDSEEPKYNLSENSCGSWAHSEDIKLVEEEPEYKVGDEVRVIGNSHGHLMTSGEVRFITDVVSEEPKYNLSGVSNGFWVGTSDIEPAHSPPKFHTGDVVKVTESFSDILGGRAICGAVYNYDECLGLGEPFVGSVFLGDNIDKIEMVCRAQDRLDKY